MANSLNRDDFIDKLVSNLPALRAKMRISQAELAEAVGIGRQTLISIENKNSKMRWDTFLSMMLVISRNNDAAEFMMLLGLDLEDIILTIDNDLMSRKTVSSIQNKLWTDNNFSGDTTIKGFAPLPIGLRNAKCPKCQSSNIRGVMIMPTADEQDPNIVCLDCGYWWD